jgi:hypothetical protein
MKMMRSEPQPLSTTARGGKIMQRRTRQKDITLSLINGEQVRKNLVFLTKIFA